MDRRSFVFGAAASCACGAARAQTVSIRGKVFESPASYIDAGLRCGAPEPNLRVVRSIGTAAELARGRSGFAIEAAQIPVNFHIIHAGNHAKIDEKHLDAQLGVLNTAFRPAGVSFFKSSVGFHDRPEWVNAEPEANPFVGAVESEMKIALGRDVLSALNFYTVDCNLLGWATFPWNLATDREMDGVVVRFDSLPGVDENASPYNEGHTATHEVGHWLGLFHTFQGGCNDPGDMVSDTPAEARPGDICEIPRDTCTTIGGSDPLHNYMNYSVDSCMVEFSEEQIERIRTFIPLFRPALEESPDANATARSSIRNDILLELGLR